MRQSKADKALDKLIEKTYYIHGNGVQINIMDIGKVFADSKADMAKGLTVDDAVKNAIAKYRLN